MNLGFVCLNESLFLTLIFITLSYIGEFFVK